MVRKRRRRAKSKDVTPVKDNRQISDLQLLEMLINEFIEKLKKNGFELKVQDVLKAIQLKQKLAKTSEAEKIFWELIDQLRKEELGTGRSPGREPLVGKE